MKKQREILRILSSMIAYDISTAVGVVIATCFACIMLAPFVPAILAILIYASLQKPTDKGSSMPSALMLTVIIPPHSGILYEVQVVYGLILLMLASLWVGFRIRAELKRRLTVIPKRPIE